MPDGLGIELFGPEHLCWLAAAAAACAGLCLLCRLLGGAGARTLRHCVGILVLTLEITRLIAQIAGGVFGLNYLPLHLCGIASYLTFIHAVRPRGSKLLGEILYSLCLPGAALALVFPDWVRYPVYNLLSIQSFSIHALIAAYPLMLVTTGHIRPNIRRLPKCFAILAVYAVPVYFFNKAAGLNFLFLNWPSPGSPLEPFEALLGRPGYILGYLPIIAAVWTLLYTPFELRRRVKWKTLFSAAGR